MLPGVYAATKKNGTKYFRSNINFKGKHISLGSYDSEDAAHRAYLEASNLLRSQSISFVDIFTLSTILSFGKMVSLMNFRDNGIYFKNPIYLRKNYFTYYISQSDELKFSIDDLFYYSSHKIMRRKGHLFVSDYGMQVNILSRFGIKNYAVEGKDYIFSNGDNTDFRYSNIIVVNQYYGVTKIFKNGKELFKVKIHINGNFVIGNYNDEDKAAIAYNKAVDIAKKHGVDKNYMTNYVIHYSPKEYAEIYTKVKISEKFLKYLKQNSSEH